MRLLTFQIFFFTFFCISNLYSQNILDENNLGNFHQGFTQSAVTTILKDHEGFMWIGTKGDGLYKYNSIDFKKYKQEFNSPVSSLNSSIILSSLKDKKNNIWIGTQQGINLYNGNLDKFESIEFKYNNSPINLEVYHIKEYDKNSLLLGTHKGLYLFDIKEKTLTLFPFKDREEDEQFLIKSLVKTQNGRFLIGTDFGLFTFETYSKKLFPATFTTENGLEVINENIVSLLISRDNSIWIGTLSSGLIKISTIDDKYQLKKYPITEKRVMSIAEYSNKTIIVGTENDGLFLIDEFGKSINYTYNKFNQNSIKSNSIWFINIDDEDRIWLGYYNNGIDIYYPNYNKFKSIKSSPYLLNTLNSNSVTSITSDKSNNLWIGLLNGGVDVFNPKEGTFINLSDKNNKIASGLEKMNIQTVFIDSKNNVWVGTWDYGLFFLKNGEKKFKNIQIKSPNSVLKSNSIMSFDEDSEGVIWIGTFLGGIYSYNYKEKKITHYKSKEFVKNNLVHSKIRKLIIDKYDNIWLATNNGAYKIKKINNFEFQISSFNKIMNQKENLVVKSRIIYGLFEDKENNIWLGTVGHGMFHINASNSKILHWYNSSNGLIHDKVNSISQDKSGNIWVGGNNGLSKLDLNNQIFTNFNTKDGLLSNNFNYNSTFINSTNTMYFGNSKGINYFNPSDTTYNETNPVIHLTNFKLSNENISPNEENSILNKVLSKTKELVLNYDQSVFTIEYIGINYTRSENNKYAYQLDGYDDDWNYVDNITSASYKNVPYGNYTFKVKASNNDGAWNDEPTTLAIKILPAWWQTNLAILSYILLFIMINFFIYKFIKERIKQKRILDYERENYKQFEALNDKKIQFFTNISHEFRTPLTLILTPLEDIIEQEDSKISKDLKEKHNIIYKNAKRLSRLINELMDFRKLQFNKMSINASKINVIPFIKEVASHYEEESSLRNIILSVEYDDEDINIWSDPTMLEKIIFNLLSNAFKATPEDGLITIQINKPKNLILLPLVNQNEPIPAIEIIIKDTGLGIKKENLDKVFDRFYQANEIDNQYYGGTGIGLELVKSFVDLHKGKIVLTSEEKVGTQFKIYFPLGYVHLKKDNINKETKKIINQYSETQKGDLNKDEVLSEKETSIQKTILIVEDNLELRIYLKNELIKEYLVKEAENGLEGLEKANKYMPDIIITDVMMPIMDGFEFCSRIKNDLKTSHIPILMVTAKGMQIDKVKGIDSGADVYLNKPFNMKVLKSHLKQLISSRQILFDKYFNNINSSIVSDNTTSLDKEFMNDVLTYINNNISDEKLNVENLAGELLLSRSKLYRKIKALTGDTANEFIRKIRLEKAKQLIENSENTISVICYKVGFSAPSYFTKCFKDHFGVLPTEIREGGSASNHE